MEGVNYGINFQYIPYEKYMEYEMPDIVINRTRDFKTSQMYESQNVQVYNNSHLTYIGNNKYEAVKYLSERLEHDIKDKGWMASTLLIKSQSLALLPDDSYISNLIKNLTGSADSDVVIKSVDGHGGSEVFLLENGGGSQSMRREIADRLAGHDCIIQERIDSDSSDIRVYVIGGNIYAAMMRTGGSDFRSNYSLGGSAMEYKLDSAQKDYVMKFVNALGGSRIGMAGIDFILAKDGRLVFNEIEEMAGSRMLYKYTGYDIVKDYVQWICKMQKEACLYEI